MLQPDAELPAVPLHPAPWELRGPGWIVALKLAPGAPAREAFLPAEQLGRTHSLVSFLMFVDYESSGCGPYRELLFIPGRFRFEDGRRHYSISRILVSTWDSVVDGRNNWGIPKDRADFEVRRGVAGGREDHVQVEVDGRSLAALAFARRRMSPSVPVHTALLPVRFRSFAQRFRGRTCYYTPEASGRARFGRLISWRFDATLFPDLSDAAVLATLEIESFHMTFPVATVGGGGHSP
jgi:hypothetical protein